MNQRDARDDLARLRQLAAEDALSLSADELAQEDMEAGLDGAAEAERWRASMRATAARVLRGARPVRNADYVPLSARLRQRPDIESLKAVVRRVFAARPQLGLAYREGTHQSDEDWQSLYDDLVDAGAIVPDEHED
jgi:hypothetical protein